MTDYTNDRWHVNRTTVTHDDFPGMSWNFCSETDARGLSRGSGESTSARSHFARAWLAAQPKLEPALKAGMLVEVTLRGGAAVSGGVTEAHTNAMGQLRYVEVGGVRCVLELVLGTGRTPRDTDIISWHQYADLR